jgi:hypothetical protein
MRALRQFAAWLSLACFSLLTASRGDVLSQWHDRSFPNPQGYDWNLSDIIFANGSFVAVGESGDFGIILTSPDGIAWTSHTPTNVDVFGAVLSVRGIASGNGRLVGLGWRGVLSVCADGTNWHQAWTGADWEFTDVVYGAGQFVAVGNAFLSATNTAFSNDGLHWTFRRGLLDQLDHVAYGDGVFLAVGPYGVVRSIGGNWSVVSSIRFRDVAFGNGIFVLAAGTNGIFARAPSLFSTPPFESVTNFPAETIAFAGGIFFALNTNGSAIFTSTNGTNWVARDINPPLSPSAPFSGYALAQGAGTLVAVGHPNRITQSSRLAGIAPGPEQGAVLLSGILGATYQIQTREGFQTNTPWLPVRNLVLTNSPQFWRDSGATNASRFYQTQLLP